ncbi:MAG: alpha/beta hydrolase [Candidatus Heimdallarchaeota archaeon]
MSDRNSRRKSFLVALILLITLVSGIFLALITDGGYGSIQISRVGISDGSVAINGVIYRPITATIDDVRPGVVLAHGISGSQQLMNGIALELARRGFVALAIDLEGHGNSEGTLSSGDPTLGTLSAVRYLELQPYINGSSLGLVGHSLGGVAVRATAFAHKNISAVATLGSGFSWTRNESVYGIVNTTFPRNFLFTVGRYDELFSDLNELRVALMPVFGTDTPVIANSVYGNFHNQNARKLVISDTIHLLEPVDPIIVSEILSRMDASLWGGRNAIIPYNNQIFLVRELSLLAVTISFLSLIVPLSTILYGSEALRNTRPSTHNPKKSFNGKIGFLVSGLTYGGLTIILFIPMTIIGFIINIPPLIFGASTAWWLLAVGLTGLVSIKILNRLSLITANIDLGHFFSHPESEFISKYTLLLVLGYFATFYFLLLFLEAWTALDLHFIVPIFNDLFPPSRLVMFILFIPFLLTYFTFEGILFLELSSHGEVDKEITESCMGAIRLLVIRTLPILVVLAFQYLPKFLFNVLPISWGLSPLLFQFFWIMLPLFATTTLISWWGYRVTGRIGGGALLNTLLLSWMLAAQFPFGSFL